MTYCLFAEELARGSMAVAALAAMQSLMGTHFVWKYGSDAIRERYLVPALRGDKIATFGLTEPNAGSDIGNLATTAERVEGGWRLRGTKTWVTNAPVADMLTVCAKTSPERGMKHIALFLVDRQFSEAIREKIVARVPAGRIARPEEIAGVHTFLASEDAAFITGQVIFVDGGMSVGA